LEGSQRKDSQKNIINAPYTIIVHKMEVELTFTLDKEASKSGGDKYVCSTNDKFTIYFPQEISRSDPVTKKPLQNLTIVVKKSS
jgi:hypothetical protein